MLDSPLARLRAIAVAEGISLILLVLIAVPLKHLFGMPLYVKIFGPIHGVLFIGYLFFLWECISEGGWSRGDILRTALASLIPFGTFINDGRLRARQPLASSSAR